MGAAIVDVAKAVLVDLNLDPLTNFGVGFTAERSYGEWDLKLEDSGVLHVDVVDANYESSEDFTRSAEVRHVVSVQIAVRQRFHLPPSERFSPDDIDPLKTMLEKIWEFFVQRELTTYTAATWVPELQPRKPIETSGSVDDLRMNHQFSGVCRINYEVVK